MKETDDEELQRLIEQQLQSPATGLTDETEDERLYKAVFAALVKEDALPAYTALADNVVATLEAEQDKKEAVKYNLIIAAVIIGGLILAVIGGLLISPAFISALAARKWVMLFVLLSIVLIQVLDRKLLRQRDFDALSH